MTEKDWEYCEKLHSEQYNDIDETTFRWGFENGMEYVHKQDVRNRAAIAAMQALIQTGIEVYGNRHYHSFEVDVIARKAVEFADSLMKELKK